MPSENSVCFLFGLWAAFLSLFLFLTPVHGLASKRPAEAPPFIVVLDPGHGGPDHGASVKSGRQRVTEKEIALGIAIRTAKVLEDPEYWKPLGRPVQVVFTRKKDTGVSLEERSRVARGGDLFLSIHANSDPSRRASGLETYFLNNTDDTSLEKLEQIEKKRKPGKRGSIGSDAALLLRSVSADAVVQVSRQAADTLHHSLLSHLRSADLKVNDRGVRQGMFYVLLDAQVPAVLLEAFFLSNNADREFVSDADNRQRIAEGIARGVLRFLALR